MVINTLLNIHIKKVVYVVTVQAFPDVVTDAQHLMECPRRARAAVSAYLDSIHEAGTKIPLTEGGTPSSEPGVISLNMSIELDSRKWKKTAKYLTPIATKSGVPEVDPGRPSGTRQSRQKKVYKVVNTGIPQKSDKSEEEKPPVKRRGRPPKKTINQTVTKKKTRGPARKAPRKKNNKNPEREMRSGATGGSSAKPATKRAKKRVAKKKAESGASTKPVAKKRVRKKPVETELKSSVSKTKNSKKRVTKKTRGRPRKE